VLGQKLRDVFIPGISFAKVIDAQGLFMHDFLRC
jgi:hypothetical protein